MLTVEEERGVERTEGACGRIPIQANGAARRLQRCLGLATATWTLDQDRAGRA